MNDAVEYSHHVDYICELIKERGGAVVWQKDGSVYFSFDLSEKYVMVSEERFMAMQYSTSEIDKADQDDFVNGLRDVANDLDRHQDQLDHLRELHDEFRDDNNQA